VYDDGANLGDFGAIDLKAAAPDHSPLMFSHPEAFNQGVELIITARDDRLGVCGYQLFYSWDIISGRFSYAHTLVALSFTCEAD
jgi:hypothetical protein